MESRLPVPERGTRQGGRARATRWLDELPSLVVDLEGGWSCIVGRVYGDATEAFVADVMLDSGTPAVLKLLIPRDANHRAYWLAARTGLEATAIWEWGVVERVSTGLV
jgi:hypothetical protein